MLFMRDGKRFMPAPSAEARASLDSALRQTTRLYLAARQSSEGAASDVDSDAQKSTRKDMARKLMLVN